MGNTAIGTKYLCDVDGTNKYIFFVLSENGENVNLIMDSNIDPTGNPIKETQPLEKGLVIWSSSGTKGPTAALDYLNTATANWTNVSALNESYTDEGNKYGTMELTGKARLPKKSEISNYISSYGGNEIFDYLSSGGVSANVVKGVYGYWTLSSYTSMPDNAWYVRYDGNMEYTGVTTAQSYGVRPVITVSKLEMK